MRKLQFQNMRIMKIYVERRLRIVVLLSSLHAHGLDAAQMVSLWKMELQWVALK